MIRIEENEARSEQDLKRQVTKRKKPHLRSSMHLIEDRYFGLNRIRVIVGSPYGVGICGGEHRTKHYSQYQGGRPLFYSAQEAQIVGDVR